MLANPKKVNCIAVAPVKTSSVWKNSENTKAKSINPVNDCGRKNQLAVSIFWHSRKPSPMLDRTISVGLIKISWRPHVRVGIAIENGRNSMNLSSRKKLKREKRLRKERRRREETIKGFFSRDEPPSGINWNRMEAKCWLLFVGFYIWTIIVEICNCCTATTSTDSLYLSLFSHQQQIRN